MLLADTLSGYERDRLGSQTRDLFKVSFVNKAVFYHPAASAGDNLIKSQEFQYIRSVDSSGWHELQGRKWGCKRLDRSKSSALYGREEFTTGRLYSIAAITSDGVQVPGKTGR